jgi:hypothetical protein
MSLEEEKKRLEGQTSELGLVLAEYQRKEQMTRMSDKPPEAS